MTPARPIAPPVSTFLPPYYRRQLMAAAELRDHQAIDSITDALAVQYPELVRPRTDVGRFESVADERRGAA